MSAVIDHGHTDHAHGPAKGLMRWVRLHPYNIAQKVQVVVEHYRARGITVCARWRASFEAFLADMGRMPEDKPTLDRIDNDGPYSPENCRWATRKEQCRNRKSNARVTIDGETMTKVEWVEKSGINPNTIQSRICHAD